MSPWRLRAEFLSLVSHELRAPLAAIKGSAATVLSGAPAPDPAEMLQFFQIINEQADQMRGLISDLLDAGHIEAGTLSVTPEPTDVADQKHLLGGYTSPQNVSTDLRMHIGDLPGKLLRKKRAKDRAMANTGKPTKTKALQVAEPPPIRPEVLTGEGDVGERVATLGRCFAGGVIHHYHLSTGHMAQIPRSELRPALLHGPEQIADLPVPVAESPGAVRIGHPERSHLVEYLAPNSVFNSLPRQRSSPHLRPDDRLVTIDRVLHHASLGVA